MLASNKYCIKKTKSSNSSFYYSFFFLSPIKREAMMTLYAFCREVDDIVDLQENKQTAKKKISWWFDEIKNTFNNNPKHAVSKALNNCLKYFNFKQKLFEDLLKGMEMDLNRTKYRTFEELETYCYNVASTVGLLSIEIFGYENEPPQEYAKNLGIAIQLINIMRDVCEDAGIGRIYIPDNLLEEFNVTKQDIFKKKYSNNFSNLMTFLTTKAISYYNIAISNLPEKDIPYQKPGLIMAHIYLNILNKIKEKKFNIFDKKISLSKFQKLIISLKTKFFINTKQQLYV